MLRSLSSFPSPIAPRAAPRGGRPGYAPKAASCVLTLLAAGGLLLAFGSRPVVLLLVAPVLEEIVFRLGLQRRLLAAGVAPAAANLLTALAFCALHAFTRSWALAVAVLPFLARNFPPARIFLGDAGSAPVGTMANTARSANPSRRDALLPMLRALRLRWARLRLACPLVIDPRSDAARSTSLISPPARPARD